MARGKPFLEVLATALNEDYRFPILEIFAFFYILGTFAITSLSVGIVMTGRIYTYFLLSSLSSLPLFIFLILILKNIAYGLGTDLEKGVVQTIFSYPLKRRSVLTAKLLSALGVSTLLFLAAQIFALWLLAPNVITDNLDVVFLTYAGLLSPMLLVAGIALLLTLKLKRGGISLIIGIVVYFALGILSSMLMFASYATGSLMPLKIYAVIYPSIILQFYYSSGPGFFFSATETWVPTFYEVILYLVVAYLAVATLFVVAYIYFDRKLGV